MRDAAATAHWKRHGWLWLRGFLGEETTRDLVRWTDEIAAWPEVPGKWMRYYERRGGDPAARMLARIENFAPFHHGLAALFSSPRLLELLAACAGEPVLLFKDKINFKLPGGDGGAAYYARKRECFPPEYERVPGVDYAARGRQFNLGNPFD